MSNGWAKIFGYTKEEFLTTVTDQSKDLELVHPDDRERYLPFYDNPNLDQQRWAPVGAFDYRIQMTTEEKCKEIIGINFQWERRIEIYIL